MADSTPVGTPPTSLSTNVHRIGFPHAGELHLMQRSEIVPPSLTTTSTPTRSPPDASTSGVIEESVSGACSSAVTSGSALYTRLRKQRYTPQQPRQSRTPATITPAPEPDDFLSSALAYVSTGPSAMLNL